MTRKNNAPINTMGNALADALHRIQEVAKDDVIRAGDMSRADRELAQQTGWLHAVIKGWYLVGSEATAQPGNTVLWYSHFWAFTKRYLAERFGEGYCLNAEASLDLHVGSTTVPKQLIVMTKEGGATTVQLPDSTSIQTYPDPGNLPEETEEQNGIRIMPLAIALSRVTPIYFRANPVNAEIALNMVTESDLSRTGLEQIKVKRATADFYALACRKSAKRWVSVLVSVLVPGQWWVSVLVPCSLWSCGDAWRDQFHIGEIGTVAARIAGQQRIA